MPAYAFEALQNDGALRKGVLEADSVKSARGQLRAQSLVPLKVQALGPDAKVQKSIWQYDIGSRKCFSANDLAVWTRQLASLVGSGLPLERALAALGDEAESQKQAHLVASLRAEVNAGLGLAKAMAQHPSEFSSLYTAVISAGEQGGNLGQVLGQLADDLQDQQTLKAKLLSASLYPAIVSVIALLIVIFLLSTVVPQVAQVFSGSQRKLPGLTVAMLALSDFVRHHGWLVLFILALAGLGFQQAMKQHNLKASDIASVVTHVHQGAIDVLGPVTDPQTVHQSKFSMGTVLALIALRNSADLAGFDGALKDATVANFRDRVTMELDEEVDTAYPQRWIGKVTVKTTDGRSVTGRVDEPKGDPGNTLSRDEIEFKAMRLGTYEGAATEAQVKALIKTVWGIRGQSVLGDILAKA